MPIVVSLTNVSKTYSRGDTTVVGIEDVSFSVKEGERVVLAGPSGSGKSTTLNLVSAVDRPDRGQLLVCGVDVRTADPKAITRLRRELVGVVFQGFHLMPNLNVAENVALPLSLAGARDPHRVAELIERVGLSDRADHFPSQLSGGEQQRAAVARALVHRPRVLLADEPTGNLDSVAGSAVLELMEELRREEGGALLLATHDASIAALADRVITFHDGRQVGTP